MSAIRSKNNQTETNLRRALFALGLRFRIHYGALEGKPDIVFPRQRVAVFIDGDYWHARLVREGGIKALEGRVGTRDQSYWISKFTRRIARDDEVTATLRANGWLVLRFWESEVKADLSSAVRRIVREVRKRKRPPSR